MIELLGLTLLRPWWLLGLPLAIAIAFVAVKRSGGVGDWRRAVDAHLLDAIARRGGVVAGKGRGALVAATVSALIALALVGPAVERSDASSFRNLDTMIVLLDLSRSVAESPEFRDAKLAALSAAEAAGTRQVAVIAFAGDAYLVAPPTTDRKGLETTLFALDGQTIPDAGSAPARALGLARKTLKDAGVVGGDVVLISDGGGIDDGARGEARGLASDGQSLSTLYVTPKTATDAPPGPRQAGRPELEALATIGGGATAGVETPEAVNERLGRNVAERLGPGAFSSLVWYDYGRWLLALAAVPALLLFRRGG
ncbi:VWA domain-containing protein [Chelatococcus sambhunathii]|uniref:VWA domain-containing protein n=1 Tax=Chelatococcus sambhunathii TaxID=363953 RepID=A0ABU1DL26_9HYPH|nr:VWA domain-containing protein [Chelatococcus sambhunathii]MDR4308846.1 VWA domain-containing protein [Chelatococcus sambhunathii]